MLNFVPSISRLHCWYAFPPGGRPGSKETVGYFNESSSETVRTVKAVQQSVHVHGSKYNIVWGRGRERGYLHACVLRLPNLLVGKKNYGDIVSHKRSGNVKFGRILLRLEKSQPRSQGLSLGRPRPAPPPQRDPGNEVGKIENKKSLQPFTEETLQFVMGLIIARCRSVIILVINKSNSLSDYRPNRTQSHYHFINALCSGLHLSVPPPKDKDWQQLLWAMLALQSEVLACVDKAACYEVKHPVPASPLRRLSRCCLASFHQFRS